MCSEAERGGVKGGGSPSFPPGEKKGGKKRGPGRSPGGKRSDFEQFLQEVWAKMLVLGARAGSKSVEKGRSSEGGEQGRVRSTWLLSSFIY